jgi:hypothetical protein
MIHEYDQSDKKNISFRLAIDDSYTMHRDLESIVDTYTNLNLCTDRMRYGVRQYLESTTYHYLASQYV